MSIYIPCMSNQNLDIHTFRVDRDDLSLNGHSKAPLSSEYKVKPEDFNQLFLSNYHLEYITNYFISNHQTLRIVTHPEKTDTCYEKAESLGAWSPLNIIKAFYMEHAESGELYVVVVPETGCFVDRDNLKKQLSLPENENLIKAKELPNNMSYGTCSPFILNNDRVTHGGRVKKILFDREALYYKKQEHSLDDFSFGLDHRLSIQMNYAACFEMLRSLYEESVQDIEILKLSFKERLTRNKGRVKIHYEFDSFNYQTARFMNEIHGYGDVVILNDHCDELFLPDVLTQDRRKSKEALQKIAATGNQKEQLENDLRLHLEKTKNEWLQNRVNG